MQQYPIEKAANSHTVVSSVVWADGTCSGSAAEKNSKWEKD